MLETNAVFSRLETFRGLEVASGGREFLFPHGRERWTGILQAFVEGGSGLSVPSVGQAGMVARDCVREELAEAGVAFASSVCTPAGMFGFNGLAVESTLEGFSVLPEVMKESGDVRRCFGVEAHGAGGG